MVNASGLITDQQLEIAAIRRHLPPHGALYAEMQFVTASAFFENSICRPSAGQACGFRGKCVSGHQRPRPQPGRRGHRYGHAPQEERHAHSPNTPLPARHTERFATKSEGQRSIVIKALEGESLQPGDCITAASATELQITCQTSSDRLVGHDSRRQRWPRPSLLRAAGRPTRRLGQYKYLDKLSKIRIPAQPRHHASCGANGIGR